MRQVGAAQLLPGAVGGPFAAAGAEAPRSASMGRRHAGRHALAPLSAARTLQPSRRAAARTWGLAAAQAINVSPTEVPGKRQESPPAESHTSVVNGGFRRRAAVVTLQT